jgi:hypothetical protein
MASVNLEMTFYTRQPQNEEASIQRAIFESRDLTVQLACHLINAVK